MKNNLVASVTAVGRSQLKIDYFCTLRVFLIDKLYIILRDTRVRAVVFTGDFQARLVRHCVKTNEIIIDVSRPL